MFIYYFSQLYKLVIIIHGLPLETTVCYLWVLITAENFYGGDGDDTSELLHCKNDAAPNTPSKVVLVTPTPKKVLGQHSIAVLEITVGYWLFSEQF